MGKKAKRKPPLRDPRGVDDLRELKKVEVTWYDAATGGLSWVLFDTLRTSPNDGLMECQTVGYLTKLGKQAITLCQTRAENGKLGNDWSIPRKWIKKIRVLP